MERDLHNFTKEVECEYGGLKFRVRDNGAVLMLNSGDGYPILWDSRWTFGQWDKIFHTMVIGAYDVQKIVAAAFHLTPRPHCVLDHIDGNKENNSLSNLRWITPAMKELEDPELCEKVMRICGSVHAFLDNPSLLEGHESEDNRFYWMANLSRDEARGLGSVTKDTFFNDKKLAYERPQVKYVDISTQSLTPNAVQVDWKVPSEFPCCPQGDFENPLEAYRQSLKCGALFCNNKYYRSFVVDAAYDPKGNLLVMTNNPEGIKGWALAIIAYEFGKFVHVNEGTFFQEIGAQKYFTLGQGKEWEGEDELLDDCC